MLPLQRHLLDLHRRVEKRGAKLRRDCAMRAVHRFRLAIKELRFAFCMVQEAAPLAMEYKAVLRPYRKLFRAAGEVREIQLQQTILQESEGIGDDFRVFYAEWLQFQTFRQCRVLQERYHSGALPSSASFSKAIRMAVRLCTAERAPGYFIRLHAEVDRLLDPAARHSDETLHTLRKTLKEYAANRKLSRDCLAYDPGELPGLPVSINGYMEHLGDRHDLAVAIGRLEADRRGAFWTPEQRAEGRKLLAIWKQRLDAIQQHPDS